MKKLLIKNTVVNNFSIKNKYFYTIQNINKEYFIFYVI